MTAKELREAIRSGRFRSPTAGVCPGLAQANLAIVPERHAAAFAALCARNPKPLPVLDILAPGEWESRHLAPGSDVRTDVPAYVLLESSQDGASRETRLDDLRGVWRPDLVTFFLGCSFSFEAAMARAGVPVRHVEAGRNVPMYLTSRPLTASHPFMGPMVVSMRPVPSDLVPAAVLATSRYPAVHGGPVHVGDPAALGIADLHRPDFGDAPDIRPGDVPVFWACGVSGLSALRSAGLDFAITHAPGHMFVTDKRDEDYAAF